MKNPKFLLTVFTFSILCMGLSAQTIKSGTLKAGASKTDITPPKDAYLSQNYSGIHDSLYVRTIVLDNGVEKAAFIAFELSQVPGGDEIVKAIVSTCGIKAENIIMTAVHDHNAVRTTNYQNPGTPMPEIVNYQNSIKEAAIKSVKESIARLQPAKVGYATGKAYINTNRDQKLGEGYHMGYNPEGPTDKTVAVVTFTSLSGQPIAIYSNYAVHAVVMYRAKTKDGKPEVTGDLPGFTSRYVESHFKGCVALWTSGAAGDQNPIFMATYNQDGPDVTDEGTGGYAILDVLSRRLGEEIVRLTQSVRNTTSVVKIWGKETSVTVPGRKRQSPPEPGVPTQGYLAPAIIPMIDGDPVVIPLHLFMINDIALAGVSGEVYSEIGQRLKSKSLFDRTIMVTHLPKGAGYIPTDAAYLMPSEKAQINKIKPGYVEPAIDEAFIGMMNEYLGSLEAPSLSNLKLGFYKSDVEFISWDLNEKFSPSLFKYTARVEKSYTATFYITPELNASTEGSIKINGTEARTGEPLKVELKPGDNIFNISVAGKNGASVDYKLTVTQKDLSKVYISEVVAPGVWRIRDFGGYISNEDMYLIEGKGKAMLFDTGMGTGDLAAYIKTLTKLPIEIAITHGNRDHFAQLDQFKGSPVYISEKDITRLPEDLITPLFKMVKAGDVIDIGAGRRFEVLEIPGHTLGCVVFLDEANKIAVVGDGIGSGERVHMYGTACAALDQYLGGLKKAEERIKNIDGLTLLVGHHYQEQTPLTGAAGKQLFTDMRILAEKILSGEITGKSAYTSRGGVTQEFRQAYYGLAGLWYNPKNMITNPASLGDLRIKTPEGKTIITSPVFSSYITSYKAAVKENVGILKIQAMVYYQNYKSMTINSESVSSDAIYSAKLSNGSNKIEVTVTANDGTTRTYSFTIDKAAAK